MPNSQNSSEAKQTARKAKLRASDNDTRLRKPKDKEGERPVHKDPSTSPIGRFVTEEQYRTRVSQKAYELYAKRLAATHLEDWFEAERLVKAELLAAGDSAGSV